MITNMRLVPARALLMLGHIYDSALDALAEYLDNAIDAGANKVIVVLASDRVMIIDNGHGMTANMLPQDREMLDLYLDGAIAGNLKDDDDIRRRISDRSRQSLEWMMRSVALSPKIGTEGTNIRGVKGIGALAFRQIGNEAVWITRPSVAIQADRPEAPHCLKPPSTTDLERQQLAYTLTESSVPLADPFGRELDSGTMVIIYDLVEGVLNSSLRPNWVVSYIQGKYGSDIRNGRVKFVVVDQYTNEGKSPKYGGSGREIVVTPPEYRGVKIVETTGYLRHGRGPFRVELFFNPEGKTEEVTLRRKGSDMQPIRNIKELDIEPLNSGQVSGYIEYPDLREAEWSSDKKTPQDGPIRNQWVKAIGEILKDALAEIEKIEQRAIEVELQRFTNRVADAALQAMREDPMFESLLERDVALAAESVPKKTRRKRSGHQDTRSIVVVKDEYNQPVEGIVVTLETYSGKPVADASGRSIIRVTGVSGTVSLGTLESGQLRVVLDDLPEGVTARDGTERLFRISPSTPRVRIQFTLDTGGEPPDIRKLKGFTIWPHALPDIEQPYRIDRLSAGVLEVNTEFPPLRRAIDEGDDAMLTALYADIVSSAVAEYALKSNPRLMFYVQCKLYASLYELIRPKSRKRRRK